MLVIHSCPYAVDHLFLSEEYGAVITESWTSSKTAEVLGVRLPFLNLSFREVEGVKIFILADVLRELLERLRIGSSSDVLMRYWHLTQRREHWYDLLRRIITNVGDKSIWLTWDITPFSLKSDIVSFALDYDEACEYRARDLDAAHFGWVCGLNAYDDGLDAFYDNDCEVIKVPGAISKHLDVPVSFDGALNIAFELIEPVIAERERIAAESEKAKVAAELEAARAALATKELQATGVVDVEPTVPIDSDSKESLAIDQAEDISSPKPEMKKKDVDSEKE